MPSFGSMYVSLKSAAAKSSRSFHNAFWCVASFSTNATALACEIIVTAISSTMTARQTLASVRRQ